MKFNYAVSTKKKDKESIQEKIHQVKVTAKEIETKKIKSVKRKLNFAVEKNSELGSKLGKKKRYKWQYNLESIYRGNPSYSL